MGVSAPCFSLETVIQTGLSPQQYPSILQSFARNHAQDAALFRHAVRTHDWESLRERAHALKGASANLGALHLRDMARTLELDMAEMSRRGLTWDKELTISSMCTVFAESEVISLIADNHTDSDIIHGLNKSIAGKTAAMAARAKGQPPYMMTGGVARNRGVVQALEEKLGAKLLISENPDLCGALGAALFALHGD